MELFTDFSSQLLDDETLREVLADLRKDEQNVQEKMPAESEKERNRLPSKRSKLRKKERQRKLQELLPLLEKQNKSLKEQVTELETKFEEAKTLVNGNPSFE
jgi:predicted RNase H-like nuclease (RuvC/YqgF family)